MSQTVTTIAPHTRIQGEVRLDGPGVILGQVQGNITAEGPLEIGAEAVIEGDIRGTTVTIHGTIKGDVTAGHECHLGAKARVAGNVCTASLAIAKGARFIGQVCVEEMEAASGAPPSAVPRPGAMDLSRLRPSHAGEEAGVLQAVEATITRVEKVSAPREERPAAMAATVAIPAAPPMPTVQILTENVQATMHRAPRIIKAR
jgi:cytoskeletal protein CcmA (bactofilin family)